MYSTAIIYCEGNFGTMDGKTANGLIRRSDKYSILGVIDSTKHPGDCGFILDGIPNGIPVFTDLDDAFRSLKSTPKYFIYGMAPASAFLTESDRNVFKEAIKAGMDIINPLYELLNEDEEFVKLSKKHHVKIIDVRATPPRKTLSNFTGEIYQMTTPVIAILGTDSAVGKRTTALLLEKELQKAGFNPLFIGTGQTGIIQGAKYALAIDSYPSQYAIGELESLVLKANEIEKPDLILVEGQGAISHPAYISSCIIVRGTAPRAIILQHAPKREFLGDFPFLKMPTLENEIHLIESFSSAKVIAITLNHERMTDNEINQIICEYEDKFNIPVADVLKQGCNKIIERIIQLFPKLKHP